MKTTIVKNSFSFLEKSVFGREKSEKAQTVHDRKRSASGIYNQSLNLYMDHIIDDDDSNQKTKRKLQTISESVSSTYENYDLYG